MKEIEVRYQRNLGDVTRDIRVQTGQFLRTAIEIGRLLYEAKAMVEPGGWGKYIEEELPFSHSWANNYMLLYKEYGSDQVSLFGDCQAFGNLRPTQALELLALPTDQREAFVAENHVEEMSTRKLHQAIQEELDKMRKLRADAEAQLAAAQAENRDLNHHLLDTQGRLSDAEDRVSAWEDEMKRLKTATERAYRNREEAMEQVSNLKKRLDQASETESQIRQQLKEAQENPVIPPDIMEQLRQEAMVEAAGEESRKLKRRLAEAEAALSKAQEQSRQAEEKLGEAQRKLKMNDPAIQEYNTLLQKLMQDYRCMDELRRKITAHDKQAGEKLRQFQEKVVEVWAENIKRH